jgi:hypothetical protein
MTEWEGSWVIIDPSPSQVGAATAPRTPFNPVQRCFGFTVRPAPLPFYRTLLVEVVRRYTLLNHKDGWKIHGKSTKQWESCMAVCCVGGIEFDLLSSDLGSRSWQLHIFGMSWNHWHGNGGADSVPATFQDSVHICPSQIHISCCWSGFVCPDSNFQLFSPIFSSCSKTLEPFAGARTVLSREGCMFGAAGVPWSPSPGGVDWIVIHGYPWLDKGCSPNHWVVNFRTPRCYPMLMYGKVIVWSLAFLYIYMVFVFLKGWRSYHLESFIRELSHSKIGWDMKQYLLGNIQLVKRLTFVYGETNVFSHSPGPSMEN